MDMDNFIGIYPEALHPNACQKIVSDMDGVFQNGVWSNDYSRQSHSKGTKRVDRAVFAEHCLPEADRIINDQLARCLDKYRNHYHVLDSVSDFSSTSVKLQMTEPKGGYHVWHCEQSDAETSRRILAWTIYLNDVPEGEGETEFLWQGVRIQPKAGLCAIWPAAFTHTHRGNPVHSCNKYIATGWFSLYK